ncbi:rhomboid-related protein 1 isoform X6 [Emydura macquarii macquarii]|uniref:rhomboid-related protein 1 isoform X6 n=1 Tax=Emydura macquarii macquarii TaxID=1129001 RepID=UPI00352A82E3
MERSSLLQLIQEQLDPENTGFIGVETFASLVHSHELPLDPAKLEMLVALAQSNDEGQICYQELVDLVSNISSKRSSSFKRAIANGQRALPRDVLLDETGLGFYKRFVRYVAYEILPCEMDRRWYFYQHRTCPPPIFMAVVTLTQIIVFLCYGARLNRLEQLGFNALLQLMIGIPLEMVHGILRISFLYLAGVLADLLPCLFQSHLPCYTSWPVLHPWRLGGHGESVRTSLFPPPHYRYCPSTWGCDFIQLHQPTMHGRSRESPPGVQEMVSRWLSQHCLSQYQINAAGSSVLLGSLVCEMIPWHFGQE